jgi:hypothetical protein
MSEPVAIDGSEAPHVVRRIVVWRRLEPGDVRTPGSEVAPESPHLEAKILEVAISQKLAEDLDRIARKKDEIAAASSGWMARYEPAGVLLAISGSALVGAWLDYLPDGIVPFAAVGVLVSGVLGRLSLARKRNLENASARQWKGTRESEELEEITARLAPGWDRFARAIKDDSGFRTDVRVGDIHQAERLVSIDPQRLAHPSTWKDQSAKNEVRYGWMYADGRVIEQTAELEDAPKDTL